MSTQVGKGKYLLSFVLLVVLTSSVYFVLNQNQVKIDIQKTYTDFFVNTNGSWDLAGKEYVKLWDGTTLMRAKSRELKTFVDGNESWVLRNSTFKDNIILEEWYYINGSSSDITMFPVSHNFTVYNGKGKLLMYEVTNIDYSGPTTNTTIPSPQYFGKNMKVEWEGGNYYSKIFQNKIEPDKIQIKWRIDSDMYSKSARLFDPPSINVSDYEYFLSNASVKAIGYDGENKVTLHKEGIVDAEYTLLYNGEQCLIECKAFEFNISLYKELPIVQEIDFYLENGSSINADIDMKISYYGNVTREVPVYKEICGDFEISNSTNETEYFCYNDIDYYINETTFEKITEKYELNKEYPIGNYTLEGYVNKKTTKNVDWVLTIPGKKLDELAWLLNNWEFKREVKIDGGDEILYNFTIFLNVSYDNKMKNNFDDLRFLNEDENEELYYEIDYKVNENFAFIWVKIPTLNKGYKNTTVYMYYGNQEAISTNNPYNAWDENYVNIWHFGEPSGEIKDSKGNFNFTHGTMNQNGVFGKQMTWNTHNSDEYKNNLYSYNLQTWEIFGSGSKGRFIFEQVPSGSMQYRVDGGSAKVNKDTINVGTYENGEYAVFRLNGNGQKLNLFRNGINTANSTQNQEGVEYGQGRIFSSWNGADTTSGTIDEIRISNVARSDTWIKRTSNISFEQFEFGEEKMNEGAKITINSPANNLNTSSSSINFNATIIPTNAEIKNVTLYLNDEEYLDLYDTNETINYFKTLELEDGSYSWNITTCFIGESLVEDCTESETRNFSIDATLPNITVISGNGTYPYYYSGINHTINFTIEDDNLDSGWWEYGKENIQIGYKGACGEGSYGIPVFDYYSYNLSNFTSKKPTEIIVYGANEVYIYNSTGKTQINYSSIINQGYLFILGNGYDDVGIEWMTGNSCSGFNISVNLYQISGNLLTKDHTNTSEISSFTTTSFVKIDEIKVGTKLNYTSGEIKSSSASYQKELLQSIVYMNGTVVNQTKNTASTTYVLDVFTNPNPDELVDRVEYWAREVSTSGAGYVQNRKVSPLLGKREFSVTFPVTKDVYDFTIYANDTYGNLASKNVNWSYVPTEFKDIGKYFNSNDLEIDIYQEKYGHDSPINISLLIDGISMSNYTMENNSENISFEIFLDDGEYNQSLEICLENGCIYSNNYTFYVDTINPIVNMTYPILNGTYYFDLIYGPNYTYEDASPGYCYYSVDEEVSDEIDAGLNFSGLLYGKGDLTITCTDYAGNEFTTDPFFIDAPSYLEIKDNASASLCGYYEYGVINITNSFITLCPYNGTTETGGATLNATRKFYSDNLTTFSGNGIGYNTSSCISGGGSILVGTAGQGEGGGGGGYNSTTFIYGAGGAGHAGIGGNGGYEVSQYKFNSGSAYGSVTNYSAELGSGGGSGGGDRVACVMGGIGGGYLKIVSPIAKVASTVTLKGTSGGNTGSIYSQSAGGGASGGTLVISSKTLDISGLKADVSGGNGGNGNAGDADVLCGAGGGSGGFVKIFYSTLTNTTVTSTLLGGAGGINSAGCNGGVSTSGSNGTISYILDNNQSVVTILSPLNNSKITESLTYFSCNATDTEGELTNLYMYLNDELINEYQTDPTDNILSTFSFPLPPGKHNLTCISEEFGIFSVPKTNTFFVDYFPNVTIINPIEGFSTYDNVSYIYYTYSPYYSGNCTLSLNGGANSTSIVGNTGLFGINSIIGANEVTIYCNNSFNNISSDTVTYHLEVIKYNEGTDEENYSADFNIKDNIYIAVDVNPVFNAIEKNITFNLYNLSGLINSTTFTDNTRDINFTDLSEGVYFYNVSICNTSDYCYELDRRVYAKQEFSFTVNGGTDPLYIELGSSLEINATDNLGELYIDLMDEGGVVNRTIISFNDTFEFLLESFIRSNFADGEYIANLTFSDNLSNSIAFSAHRYDEVDSFQFNITGYSSEGEYPENIQIYNQRTGNLEKYFVGELVGKEIYMDKTYNLTLGENSQDTLDFSANSNRNIYFLVDKYSKIKELTFKVLGLSSGLSYTSKISSSTDEIDFTKTTGMIRLGRMLPKGTDIKNFVYDSFIGSVINTTLWNIRPSGTYNNIEGSNYKYIFISSQNNKLRLDLSFSEEAPSNGSGSTTQSHYAATNYSLLNFFSSENISFNLKFYNDQYRGYYDYGGRTCSAYDRVLFGNTVIYQSKFLPCSRDTTGACTQTSNTIEDLKFTLEGQTNNTIKVTIQGSEYHYADRFNYNACGWAKYLYNYTNNSLTREYRYPGSSCGYYNGVDYLSNEYYVSINNKNINALYFDMRYSTSYRDSDDTGCIGGDGYLEISNMSNIRYNYSTGDIYSNSIIESEATIYKVNSSPEVIFPECLGNVCADTSVYGFLSTDGSSYTPIINYNDYTQIGSPGKELSYRYLYELEEPGYHTIFSTVIVGGKFENEVSYPSDIYFDFGNDGTIDYFIQGNLTEQNGSIEIKLSNLSLENATSLRNLQVENIIQVPLTIKSSTEGTLELSDYTFIYNPNPIVFNSSMIQENINSLNGRDNFSLEFLLNYGENSSILLDNLKYLYAGGDKIYKLVAHTADWSRNISVDLNYIYSRWDYQFNPFNVDYIFFSPRTAVSKNVEPYGQVASKRIPLLNITNYGYGSILGKNETELFVYLNDTLGCVNTTMSITNNKSQGILLANEWNKIAENVSYLENVPIYLWADYSCDYSNYWLYNPYLYFAQEINGTISDKNL